MWRKTKKWTNFARTSGGGCFAVGKSQYIIIWLLLLLLLLLLLWQRGKHLYVALFCLSAVMHPLGAASTWLGGTHNGPIEKTIMIIRVYCIILFFFIQEKISLGIVAIRSLIFFFFIVKCNKRLNNNNNNSNSN
jgi:hypothetical protein